MAYLDPGEPKPHNANPSTLTSDPSSIAEAISQLQARWHTLSDFERARAIRPIIRAGLSRRNLASALGTSEATIRQLLLVLEADPADQALFRQDKISRNELIHRAKKLQMERDARQKQSEQQLREAEAIDGCRTILNWLAADDSRCGDAFRIIEDVRWRLDDAERGNALPRERAPKGMSVDEIIRRCQPDPNAYEYSLTFHSVWMFLWTFFLMPDRWVQWTALDQALERVSRSNWMRCL